MSKSGKLEYAALDPSSGDIRLLNILPPNVPSSMPDGEFHWCPPSEHIECGLQHYQFRDYSSTERIEQDGTFIALSYTWGDKHDEDEIHIGSSRIVVRRNLKKALQALRETEEVRDGCKVWADALCINQDDVQEKNREVRRMGEIYKKCWKIAMWLGEADTESDEAIDFINNISKAREQGLETTRDCLRKTLSSSGPFTL
jgi:hypothetical protein